MASSLNISVFFELLWLDLFPAGTFIPPNGGASVLVSVFLVHHFGLKDPVPICLVLFLTIPLAVLCSRLESMQRGWQNAGYNHLLLWMRRSSEATAFSPERLVQRSLIQLTGLYWLFFFGSLCILTLLLGPLLSHVRIPLRIQPSWAFIWLVGSLGGLLSLRIRRAYALLGACMALLWLLVLLHFLGGAAE